MTKVSRCRFRSSFMFVDQATFASHVCSCCIISLLKLTRFYQRLTPDTILQLRRNDPEVKDLWVRFEPDRDFAALRDVDWEKEGACISNNSQLETLSIYGSSSLRRSTSFQNAAAAFFEAVARNTSITTLELN